ncbi:hypothetical protein GO497_24220 [Acidovorax citrulli]|nr:hypothetical protein [Paracidovorax citrulli]
MPAGPPDGKQVAFISMRTGSSQVFVIARHGGEARQVGALDGTALSAEWSPDGCSLAVLCTVAVDPELRGRRPGPDAPPRARVARGSSGACPTSRTGWVMCWARRPTCSCCASPTASAGA